MFKKQSNSYTYLLIFILLIINQYSMAIASQNRQIAFVKTYLSSLLEKGDFNNIKDDTSSDFHAVISGKIYDLSKLKLKLDFMNQKLSSSVIERYDYLFTKGKFVVGKLRLKQSLVRRQPEQQVNTRETDMVFTIKLAHHKIDTLWLMGWRVRD